jgi:hypothetical protein
MKDKKNKFHKMEKFNRALGLNPDAGELNMEMLNMQSKSKGVKGKKGGGNFPDLTGDGKVTQKDILRGRGVPGIKRGGGLARRKRK